MRRWIAFSLLSVTLIASCKSRVLTQGKTKDIDLIEKKFDIIDMSFLMPLPSLDGFVLKGGPGIFPKDQFMRLHKDFLDNFSDRYSPDQLYENLYITGFRYDPCFPIVSNLDPNAPGCRLRAVRLVGQFVDLAAGEVLPASMHILFIMKGPDSASDLKINGQMIEALKQLRKVSGVDTQGVGLGVHPGFKGANNKVFGEAVTQMVSTFAGSKNYFANSVFFENKRSAPGTTEWAWAQFLMKPLEGNLRGLILEPTTGMKAGMKQDFGRMVLNHKTGDVTLNPNDSNFRDIQDPTNPLFFPIPRVSPLFAKLPSQDQLKAGITATDVIENPTMMTIPAGDCVSCHVTTQRRLHAESQLTDAGFARLRRFNNTTGLTGEMDADILKSMKMTPSASPESVIQVNFGYIGSRPVVSQRTVNEAVLATKLVNESMWTFGNASPALQP